MSYKLWVVKWAVRGGMRLFFTVYSWVAVFFLYALFFRGAYSSSEDSSSVRSDSKSLRDMAPARALMGWEDKCGTKLGGE